MLILVRLLFGVKIKTPEEFIEDLRERINQTYSAIYETGNEELREVYLLGFL